MIERQKQDIPSELKIGSLDNVFTNRIPLKELIIWKVVYCLKQALHFSIMPVLKKEDNLAKSNDNKANENCFENFIDNNYVIIRIINLIYC